MALTSARYLCGLFLDVKSFVVLQHAFFSNNTVHLLVWHESDGLPGLDGLSEKLQLIRVRKTICRRSTVRIVSYSNLFQTKDSVLPILVVLTTKLVPQETQSRIDEFAKYPGFKREAIKAVVQIQKGGISLLPLREELRKVAENLTTVSHSYKGEPRNWVIRLTFKFRWSFDSKIVSTMAGSLGVSRGSEQAVQCTATDHDCCLWTEIHRGQTVSRRPYRPR